MNIHKLLFNLWLWIQPAHFIIVFFSSSFLFTKTCVQAVEVPGQ